MADESEWAELLDSCNGSIPDAWVGIGALVQANVGADWQLPPVPEDACYSSYPIHSGKQGRVVLLKWREGQTTLPHSWPGRRVFHCLVRGRLHQRIWQWQNGLLVPTGERRVHAPDVLVAFQDDEIRSYSCTEEAFTLTIYTTDTSEDELLALYDPDEKKTRWVPDATDPWGPPDEEQVKESQAWS